MVDPKPKRPEYHVILKDLTHDDEDPNIWSTKVKMEIVQHLTEWFEEICKRSMDFKTASAVVKWSSNKALVENDELVCYFLPSKSYSLITKLGGRLPDVPHGGATCLLNGSMISEVHIRSNLDGNMMRDLRHSRLLALVAFHELMHNKLDADESNPGKHLKKPIADLHQHDGVAKAHFASGDRPSTNNLQLMAENLSLEHVQYTADLFSCAVGSVIQEGNKMGCRK